MSAEEDSVNLKTIARDIRETTLMLREVVKYMKDAESEIPEKMRRFIMYFHDVHDIWWLYMQTGQLPPEHIKREIERCADRYRHILDDLYGDQGTFERVRQEMSKRAGNTYDHSRMVSYETGSRNKSNGGDPAKEPSGGGEPEHGGADGREAGLPQGQRSGEDVEAHRRVESDDDSLGA